MEGIWLKKNAQSVKTTEGGPRHTVKTRGTKINIQEADVHYFENCAVNL